MLVDIDIDVFYIINSRFKREYTVNDMVTNDVKTGVIVCGDWRTCKHVIRQIFDDYQELQPTVVMNNLKIMFGNGKTIYFKVADRHLCERLRGFEIGSSLMIYEY